MRSWPSALILVLATACGTDSVTRDRGDTPPTDPSVCEDSYVTYNTFGAAFTASWCRGCHSSSIPEGERQDAPLGVDFDTEADLRTWQDRIRVRATGATPTMPPVGGPSDAERQLLVEWIDCGMQ